ncbi:MAG: coproporphyrinogen dehydrogenase HemZ [Clostridiales bacterium]|jgi:oxygen-independent coproporphyrinogen-3 oxidase|nr:coproporphyrinogen dehydrogenase HemZ [Clostridiales bacterium]
MYCIINAHGYINETQCISQIFFPNEKFIIVSEPQPEGVTLLSSLSCEKITARIYENGKFVLEEVLPFPQALGENAKTRFLPQTSNDTAAKFLPQYSREAQALSETATPAFSKKAVCNAIQKSVFYACMKYRPAKAPWGLLVGIRPTKIVHEMWESGFTTDEIKRYLTEFYLASDDKANLCVTVAEAEKRILRQNTHNSVSLYIGVPFCVSRCLYCSFSSYILKRYEKYIDAYVAALVKELTAASAYISGKSLQTIYIGGGTPTSLTASQLEVLLGAVNKCFDISSLSEYTVEAGRPDTLNDDKLNVLKANGVSRVCVNPQTLNNETLVKIGRSHSAADFYSAYNSAVKTGLNVNVDIILGLPGETEREVKYTLDELTKLSPDNLTVHTLAVKRASALKEQLENAELTDAACVNEMLSLSDAAAREMNLFPYYMYRQKNMLGNYENVGYCKKGKEGIYNIQIIEEKQTIVAVGAGAATKHYDSGRNLIRRVYNVKTPEEYINRIDEMIERKNKLYEFDSEHS